MDDSQGIVFNIQRFSLHDGPGIRTIVFLKGCPLSCWWCSNPESQKLEPDILYFKDSCIGCKRCLEVCPTGALVEASYGPRMRSIHCQGCGQCVQACHAGALRMMGKWMSVSDIMEEVESDRAFYNDSRGGMTLSGGEPTYQFPFSLSLIKEAQKRGIHSAVETCGYQKREILYEILKEADMVFFDLKHMDPVQHKQITGMSNRLILENLSYMARQNIPLIIRIPIIPALNDSIENIIRTARFASQKIKDPIIELVPYHRFGEYKYTVMGKKYRLKKCNPPRGQHLNKILSVIQDQGVKARIS